jgi:hypothetical protein
MNFSQAATLAWKLKLDFLQVAPNDGQLQKRKMQLSPREECIFLLTMQHQYLNILCVSIQQYNSLGFKKVRSGSKATKSS